MAFKKAVKTDAKLRLAINGPAGSGKTYTSLAIGTALANGKPVAVVDTEHGSASKYADLFEFDVMELAAPFHPNKYVEAITEAASAGYGVIVLDSLTHAWNGEGGLLDIVEMIAKRMKNPNTFAAWKDATPIQNKLIEAIIAADIHIIATMRSKTEYVLNDNKPRKVGTSPVQREGFEYEFDVVFDMDVDNNAIVTKTRCPALTGGVFNKPGANVAKTLTQWLQGAPSPKPVVSTKPSAASNAEIDKAPQGPQQEVDFYSSEKPSTNGANAETKTTNADNPFDGQTPPKLGAITKAQTGTLHALGVALYGDTRTWDAKRHGIVKAITNGRVESSALLTQAEAKTLIEKLETKIREHYSDVATELHEQQIEQPDVDPDSLNGVELANAYTALCKLMKPETQPQPVGK